MMKALEDIPGVSWVIKRYPHLDYEGQRLSEKIYQFVIVLFSVVGVVWGYICQQFDQTIYIILAGFALAILLVLPPWPFYRRNPLPWQKVDIPTSSSNKGSSKGNKNRSRKNKNQ